MEKKFKRNLLIGFGASLIILAISSVASFISIRNLLDSADLVSHTNEVILELNRINAALIDAETGQRGFLLTGEPEYLSPYENARVRASTALARVKEMTVDNPEQQNSLPTFGVLVDDRFHYLDTSINDKRAGKEIDVNNLRRGKNIMDNVREIIATMQQRERDLLAQRTETMNQFASFTPPLIISAAMIALLITVSFYVRVKSDFDQRLTLQRELEQKDVETSHRISIIRGISDRIAQGHYDSRVNDLESDALGSVAGSLNKMAESLQYSFGILSEKEWTKTGMNQLNDVLIGEKNVDVLCRDVIQFLANYTNSNAGAFYILEKNELRFCGGYAYTPDKSRDIVHINDGLLGQAIATGKWMELKDIPTDTITISFATGAARPRHVIALPIYDGYVIKGAVEFATLGTFSQREIDFMSSCASNVGIAISTAQNRKRLQELLEETQAQSEELKTQHSELENLNSELEVQSEKLQASEEELKVQQEELKQANQELEERSRLLEEKNQLITERNYDIQAKAEQLEQSTRYKSEFLANMSHELRTPLNSILLLSRLMSENQEQNLSPDQIEYARVIQSSGHGLLSLIDEILDLSKIEAGKMKLEFQPVSLKEMIADMKGLFAPLAQEKNIEFRSEIVSEVPETIETDKLRLEQIVRNLLSNAVKFTTKGYVLFSVKLDGGNKDYVKILVKDTGIGIPANKQSVVFEAFQQADGSTRRKFGGTGLGLSISRELAKLLGGEIALRSEAGEGSEFEITLPLKKRTDASPIEPASAPRQRIEEEFLPEASRKPANGKQYISTHIPENIPDDRNKINAGDKRILIIEDDVNFAKSLLEFSRKKGYKGIVAVRGDEGISLAKQFVPSGILLDIQLPIKSGWEVMEELKNNPETRHIPVHIMSSHEAKTESLMKGAVDFINKPVAFDQMQDIFNKIEYVLTHHPKKVLIVEENARHAKALAYFLESFDVNLETKNDVDDAIVSLRDQNTDCVILDMGVPDQKAYDTLDAVKKTPGLENLPIIIFTGKRLSQHDELRIKQYADSIVVKTAHSYKRILDEVSLFLHLVEKHQKPDQAPRFPKLGALDEVLKDKTVLVADDDMRNIFSMTKALEQFKMNVIAAVDGKDALSKLKAHKEVDIVLMDMMMPEMDGYETTAAIRKDSLYKDLPVIAVTAKAMVGDREKCIKAGASDYITKPVDIDQLLSLLRVWLYESGRK